MTRQPRPAESWTARPLNHSSDRRLEECSDGPTTSRARTVHDVAREIHASDRGQLANARPFAGRCHHRVLAAALSRPAAHEGASEALQHGLAPHIRPAFCPQLPAKFHIMKMSRRRPNVPRYATAVCPPTTRISIEYPPPRQIQRLRPSRYGYASVRSENTSTPVRRQKGGQGRGGRSRRNHEPLCPPGGRQWVDRRGTGRSGRRGLRWRRKIGQVAKVYSTV